MKYIRDDDQVTPQRAKPGTVRRVLPYFARYRWAILLLLFITAVDSATTVVNPVLLGFIVDDGILRHRGGRCRRAFAGCRRGSGA